MASSSEDAVSQLTAMGFEEAQVQQALNVTNGNMEQAVNFLLGGGISSAATESLSQSSSLVLCYTSQYSVENGRSACTCIGLMGAALFLQSQDKNVTRELLERMVIQGVAAYQRLPTSSNNVEHLSAEEVLQSNSIEEFKSLSLVASARQGFLSGNSSHPLGLKALLQACQSEQTVDEWMAVVITKPPETVVVLLSPSQYILMDSHPRPGVEGSYARIHSSLDDLVQSLQAIYPVTELGPDVPEMMAMMYNSFDVYPLTWKEETTTNDA